jgi:hypothetical protein
MEIYRLQGRLQEARRLGEEGPGAGAGGDVGVQLRLVYAELGEAEPLLALLAGRPGEGPELLEAGTHAVMKGQYAAAITLLRRGLEREPLAWAEWLVLCKALVRARRFAETLDLVPWIMERTEGDLRAQAGFLAGVCHLLEGRFPEGFRWMEWRHAMEGGPHLEELPMEPWRGEPLAGRKLLLQAEQGFGDVFMMARYVPVLAAMGAGVLMQPQPGTWGVLETCEGLEALVEGQVVLRTGTLKAPVMTLPLLCGTTLQTIPADVPYLRVPDHVPSREAIDALLDSAPPGRRIGLVWAGNPTHHQDDERSMPPEVLEVLGDVPGVTWVDFQVRRGPRPGLPMLDLASLITDFSDSAYALGRMDGIISVDSSPVHLAGALGTPVWLAVAHLPDWRWMLDRRDSPWYPTVEIWRQPEPGDWASVLESMRERLLAAPLDGSGLPSQYE